MNPAVSHDRQLKLVRLRLGESPGRNTQNTGPGGHSADPGRQSCYKYKNKVKIMLLVIRRLLRKPSLALVQTGENRTEPRKTLEHHDVRRE